MVSESGRAQIVPARRAFQTNLVKNVPIRTRGDTNHATKSLVVRPHSQQGFGHRGSCPPHPARSRREASPASRPGSWGDDRAVAGKGRGLRRHLALRLDDRGTTHAASTEKKSVRAIATFAISDPLSSSGILNLNENNEAIERITKRRSNKGPQPASKAHARWKSAVNHRRRSGLMRSRRSN
jgi:hypothetical protein